MHGTCFDVAIAVIVVSALGMIFAKAAVIIIYIREGRHWRLGIVALLSALTNLATLIASAGIAGKGLHYRDCTNPSWQAPIVWPVFITAVFACLLTEG
jgi:MFS family permease